MWLLTTGLGVRAPPQEPLNKKGQTSEDEVFLFIIAVIRTEGRHALKLADILQYSGSIKTQRLYDAFLKIRRSDFIPDTAVELADSDFVIQTYSCMGKTLSTNSQPSLIAQMLEMLNIQSTQTLLEIGTGTGFCTALLAFLLEKGKVFSVDIHESITKIANTNLRKYAFENVALKTADGFLGWSEQAPFDSILSTVAIGDIPSALFDQLKIGGTLLYPVYLQSDFTPLILCKKPAENLISGNWVFDAVFLAMEDHKTPFTTDISLKTQTVTFKKTKTETHLFWKYI